MLRGLSAAPLVIQDPKTLPRPDLTCYLIFAGDTGTGTLVGPPQELSENWWLVLREQSGSGTGFYEWIQRWFDLGDGRVNEVPTILDHGYLLGYPGGYAFVLDSSAGASLREIDKIFRPDPLAPSSPAAFSLLVHLASTVESVRVAKAHEAGKLHGIRNARY